MVGKAEKKLSRKETEQQRILLEQSQTDWSGYSKAQASQLRREQRNDRKLAALDVRLAKKELRQTDRYLRQGQKEQVKAVDKQKALLTTPPRRPGNDRDGNRNNRNNRENRDRNDRHSSRDLDDRSRQRSPRIFVEPSPRRRRSVRGDQHLTIINNKITVIKPVVKPRPVVVSVVDDYDYDDTDWDDTSYSCSNYSYDTGWDDTSYSYSSDYDDDWQAGYSVGVSSGTYRRRSNNSCILPVIIEPSRTTTSVTSDRSIVSLGVGSVYDYDYGWSCFFDRFCRSSFTPYTYHRGRYYWRRFGWAWHTGDWKDNFRRQYHCSTGLSGLLLFSLTF